MKKIGGQGGAADAIAERIHSAAIRLIRRLRNADVASGLSGPNLSALSVLVFGGPQSLKSLAAAEQVRAPTMSRIVAELERRGLATKVQVEEDRRGIRIAATAKGRALLEAGRARRLEVLTKQIEGLSREERLVVQRAAEILTRLNEGR